MVKIRPLGHVSPERVPRLIDVLGAELSGAPVYRATLGPETIRIAGQWLAAPVTGLEEVGAVVFEATEPIVPVTHPQPFRTDLILARGRAPANLAGKPVSASWSVDSLALVADRSSPHGPRFDDLAVFQLGN